MRRQAATRSGWTSFLARCGFALTVLVVVPFAVTKSAFVVHRARTPADRPSEMKNLLEFEHEMERLGHPIHATPPEWPPQDPPINFNPGRILQYGPLRPAQSVIEVPATGQRK